MLSLCVYYDHYANSADNILDQTLFPFSTIVVGVSRELKTSRLLFLFTSFERAQKITEMILVSLAHTATNNFGLDKNCENLHHGEIRRKLLTGWKDGMGELNMGNQPLIQYSILNVTQHSLTILKQILI